MDFLNQIANMSLVLKVGGVLVAAVYAWLVCTCVMHMAGIGKRRWLHTWSIDSDDQSAKIKKEVVASRGTMIVAIVLAISSLLVLSQLLVFAADVSRLTVKIAYMLAYTAINAALIVVLPAGSAWRAPKD